MIVVFLHVNFSLFAIFVPIGTPIGSDLLDFVVNSNIDNGVNILGWLLNKALWLTSWQTTVVPGLQIRLAGHMATLVG